MGQASWLTRVLIAVVALGPTGAPAAARDFLYKEWRFDTDAVPGELSAALATSLQAQIDLVESLPVKPEIMDFFRHVEVKVDPETIGLHAFYRAQVSRRISVHRVELGTLIEPPDRPLLLRMLLFAYLEQRVPEGRHNRKLGGWLEDAKRSGVFPYKQLVHSPENFFALGAGAILWGRGSPDAPVVRAKLRETVPDFYDWVAAEFYPAGEPAR
jgi:hypothetical protein